MLGQRLLDANLIQQAATREKARLRMCPPLLGRTLILSHVPSIAPHADSVESQKALLPIGWFEKSKPISANPSRFQPISGDLKSAEIASR